MEIYYNENTRQTIIIAGHHAISCYLQADESPEQVAAELIAGTYPNQSILQPCTTIPTNVDFLDKVIQFMESPTDSIKPDLITDEPEVTE